MYSDNKLSALELFLRRISGCDKEPGENTGDHSYAKAWNSHDDSERTKPAKMLFMNAVVQPKSVHTYPDEEIDVLSESPSDAASPFDNQQSERTANDLENSLKCYFDKDVDKSELYDIQVENLHPYKRNYHRAVMQLIDADILAKTTYAGQQHEFIKRRLITEKCARQMRIVLANTFYDFDDLIIWLQKLILDKGDLATVSSYLSILQALTIKIPDIVNKILRMYSGRFGFQFLWDLCRKDTNPTSLVYQNKNAPKKVPGDPYMIFNCAGFDYGKAAVLSTRLRLMIHNFNGLCKTIFLPNVHDITLTYEQFARDSLISTKARLMEIKNHFPNQPVILGGWTTGALIACYIALEVEVTAVVCFGFPLTGINGSSDDLNDPLLELKAPTLFVIGQNSNTCSIDDIEDFRSRMTAESSLIIVGGANDYLCVSPTKLIDESITQDIVDRCIVDEVGDFLHTCLAKLPTGTSLMTNNPFISCDTIMEESVEEDVSLEVDGKCKRKRPKEYSPELPTSRKRVKEYSPELPTSRKRVKLSVPKEIPNASTKSRLSPSSSETSSSGSFMNVKQTSTKAAKKFPEKRRGRPPSATSRKKTPPSTTSRKKTPPGPAVKPSETAKTSKPSKTAKRLKPSETAKKLKPSETAKKLKSSETAKRFKPSETAKTLKPSETAKTLKPVSPAPIVLSPPKRRSPLTARKISPSVALSILQKDNDPVDVETASDSETAKRFKPSETAKTFKPVSSAPIILSPPKRRSPLTARKISSSFAVSILPKKNYPVDVGKAFGKDSSFLPRPLTPPEPEDTISAEETEKAMAELEGNSVTPSTSSKVHTTDPCSSSHNISNKEKTFVPLSSKVHTTDPCSSSHVISNNEKTFVPLSKQPSVAILGSKAIPGSIMKRTLNSTTDPKKGIPHTATSGFQTVFQLRKMIPPGSGSAKQMKNMPVRLTLNPANTSNAFTLNPANTSKAWTLNPANTSKALTLNPANTSKALTRNPPNTSKATFTVPPNTILVSSQKTPGGKVQLLLSKGQMPLKTKDQLTSKPVSSINNNNESSEQQSFNLSLLSDVAGMTEPLVDSSKKVNTGTHKATVIKLSVPDKMHNLNRNPVLKPIHARSAPTRIDTPGERAEKRLAVQALNESVGISSSTPSVSEPSYSICYVNPDGSVVSRVVSKPGPATYIRQPIITQPPGRGKIRPILQSKAYSFYHE